MSDTVQVDGGLDRLTAASHALTYAVSLDEVLEITVASAEHLTGASCVVLLLPDEDGRLLRIRAASGLDSELASGFSAAMNESLLGRLSAALNVSEGRFLAVPLVVTGKVVGLLTVLLRGREPEERDEWLLAALADQAAVAVDATRLSSGHQELERRLARLEVSDRRHENALRIVRHDLRTPLAAMQGYLELLVAETYGPVTARQRRVFERLRVAAHHIGSILENVDEMGRLQAGEIEVRREAVEVWRTVKEARALVAHLTSATGSEVVVDVVRGLDVMTDGDRLRQVLVQLLDNALRYSPAGSEVVVTASTDDAPPGMVALRVTDAGPGIEPVHGEAVFEPYRRFSSEPGTGLGLSIGRAIMRLMDGDLVLETRDGPGATFAVLVPRA